MIALFGDYALFMYKTIFGIIPIFDTYSNGIIPVFIPCFDGIIPLFTPYFNGIIPLFEPKMKEKVLKACVIN